MFVIEWAGEAKEIYELLKVNASQKKRYRATKKTIKLLAVNPRYPSLQTHEFTSLKGQNGEKVFVAYAEQNTPAAYRVFWYYGTEDASGNGNPVPTITILTITSHP